MEREAPGGRGGRPLPFLSAPPSSLHPPPPSSSLRGRVGGHTNFAERPQVAGYACGVRRRAKRRGAGLPEPWLRIRGPPPTASGIGVVGRADLLRARTPPAWRHFPRSEGTGPAVPPSAHSPVGSVGAGRSAAPASSEPRAQFGADAPRAGRWPSKNLIRPPGGEGSAGVSGAPVSRHRLLGPSLEPTASQSKRQTLGEGDRRRVGGEFPERGKPPASRFPFAWYPHRVTAQATGEDLSTFTPTTLPTPKCTLLGAQGWELLNHAGFFAP